MGMTETASRVGDVFLLPKYRTLLLSSGSVDCRLTALGDLALYEVVISGAGKKERWRGRESVKLERRGETWQQTLPRCA